jgi:hypothetical protein
MSVEHAPSVTTVFSRRPKSAWVDRFLLPTAQCSPRLGLHPIPARAVMLNLSEALLPALVRPAKVDSLFAERVFDSCKRLLAVGSFQA